MNEDPVGRILTAAAQVLLCLLWAAAVVALVAFVMRGATR